jgi:hypothetical protein
VLSSIDADAVVLEFFLLPGVSFSVGSRTYIHWPLGSMRHRSRVMGVLVPRLPTPPSASSSSSSRLLFSSLTVEYYPMYPTSDSLSLSLCSSSASLSSTSSLRAREGGGFTPSLSSSFHGGAVVLFV